MSVEVWELVWDEENEKHINDHGLTVREVNQVVANFHIVVRNRKHRRAQHLMIGRTHGGRVLVVALSKTRVKTTWRPVTAHMANESQKRELANQARSRAKE
jgi:uncharacterized DUF497 family protein